MVTHQILQLVLDYSPGQDVLHVTWLYTSLYAALRLSFFFSSVVTSIHSDTEDVS